MTRGGRLSDSETGFQREELGDTVTKRGGYRYGEWGIQCQRVGGYKQCQRVGDTVTREGVVVGGLHSSPSFRTAPCPVPASLGVPRALSLAHVLPRRVPVPIRPASPASPTAPCPLPSPPSPCLPLPSQEPPGPLLSRSPLSLLVPWLPPCFRAAELSSAPSSLPTVSLRFPHTHSFAKPLSSATTMIPLSLRPLCSTRLLPLPASLRGGSSYPW